METNPKLELAERIINETGTSLFLTGKAGTGKTTFLHHLRAKSRKRMVVAAPTGIAAINAGGVTLHSFFQLDFGIFIPGAQRSDNGSRRRLAFSKEKIKIIRGLDLLVIDEVSMVRADLLDAVDEVLRRYRDHSLPFGGVQLLLIGDLQQLPPVVTDAERSLLEANYASPYFFDSNALRSLDYVTIELDKVYRQNDAHFLNLLNHIRENKITPTLLEQLNARHIANFNPADDAGYVRLTTHNRRAETLNKARLALLPGEEFCFSADVSGEFPESSFPAERELRLKKDAQVMFIKNDTGTDRRFFNGMLGTIVDIDADSIFVRPAGSDEEIEVPKMEWENVKFAIDSDTHQLKESVAGVFRQYPLKTAWAITIHKSQGLTFSKAIIDASAAFAHGQTYVALSRCRNLEGLVLEKPLSREAVITDPTVSQFMATSTLATPSEQNVESMSRTFTLHVAASLFDFRPIFQLLDNYSRVVEEAFMSLFPSKVVTFVEKAATVKKSLNEISGKFAIQLARIRNGSDQTIAELHFQQRLKDAAKYFLEQLDAISQMVEELHIDHDNKDMSKRLAERYEALSYAISLRHLLLHTFRAKDFNTETYFDVKAEGAFRTLGTAKQKRKRAAKGAAEATLEATADNLHPHLYNQLLEWRNNTAKRAGVPAYVVLYNKTLLTIANLMPEDFDTLAKVKGMGKVKIKQYADAILDVVQAYKEKHGGA